MKFLTSLAAFKYAVRIYVLTSQHESCGEALTWITEPAAHLPYICSSAVLLSGVLWKPQGASPPEHHHQHRHGQRRKRTWNGQKTNVFITIVRAYCMRGDLVLRDAGISTILNSQVNFAMAAQSRTNIKSTSLLDSFPGTRARGHQTFRLPVSRLWEMLVKNTVLPCCLSLRSGESKIFSMFELWGGLATSVRLNTLS